MQKEIQHDLELKPTYPVKDLYTVKEVSEILIVNVNVVYDLIKSGTLKALKLGRYKIRRTTLLEFLERYETYDITDINDNQCPYECSYTNFFLNTGHCHHTVTGEQFASDKDDHHQTDREDAAGNQTCKTDICNIMHGNITGLCAKRDADTSHDSHEKNFLFRSCSFFYSAIHVGLYNFLWSVKH